MTVLRPSVLYSGSSQYGTYRIVDATYEDRPARLLYGADNSLQSGVALDDNPELLFDYNQRFLEMLMSHDAHKILVIGGGTGTFAAAAFRLFPNLTIDVVEIDKLLIDLGHEFFDLPHSPRLRLVADDATNHLAKTSDLYDMIIIDAFFGYAVPPPLVQLNTIQQYHRHLTDSGVVAMNLISKYKKKSPSLAHEMITSFSSVFSHVSMFQSDPEYRRGEEQNHILAASNNRVRFDYLQSKEVEPA